MYTLETIESLQAYADRLHRDVASSRRRSVGSPGAVRTLFRAATKGRRTS
jgi:hypothetical protein